MPLAICVEDLAKKYLIRHERQASYSTLRESLANGVRECGRRLAGATRLASHLSPPREEFWALRGVSFKLARGERLGVIGRNGAGKSTLLKVLSRITEPSRGRVSIKGRIASLLEVGTGFHPELTGRENIYLNGAVLGMRREEIRKSFDAIVAFAEVERFLDTPVKRYSSGMYLRLAFAVAAHLEPEILLVDEVLAVGDAEFQSRCLGKMEDVSHNGRTIIFVSHNMNAIVRLCDSALLLEKGEVVRAGPAAEVVSAYLGSLQRRATEAKLDLTRHECRIAGIGGVLRQVELRSGGMPTSIFRMGDDMEIALSFASPKRIENFGITVENLAGERLFTLSTVYLEQKILTDDTRTGVIRCLVDALPLVPGVYQLSAHVAGRTESLDVIRGMISFSVVTGDVSGSGRVPGRDKGVVYVASQWRLQP